MHRYLLSFRCNWRPLLAASLGLSAGMPLNPFAMSLLAPHLLHAMGWSRANFALTTALSGLSAASMPIVGRFADTFGVTRVASIGVAAAAASYLGFGLLHGAIGVYVALVLMQVLLGCATTGPVYLQLIVRNFHETRGVALAVAVSMPAVVAATCGPAFSKAIEHFGWRAGCFMLAAYAATGGIVALALVPRTAAPKLVRFSIASLRDTRSIRELVGQRRFRLLILVILLVTLPASVMQAQFALVLIDRGMAESMAGEIVAVAAVGIIVGRFLIGLALDRFEAELVGSLALCLPGIGMLMLAGPFAHTSVLVSAVLLIGLATGAEGDLMAYLNAKHFGFGVFSSALGLTFAAVGVCTMLGGIGMSVSLRLTGHYAAFLVFAAFATFLGSVLLLRLRAVPGGIAEIGPSAT